MASVEILTEHHEHVPFLVKDDTVEILPDELLNWPLVPMCWDLLTGLMCLESKLERSHSLQKRAGSGALHPGPDCKPRKGFSRFYSKSLREEFEMLNWIISSMSSRDCPE